MGKHRILVVDDDRDILELLEYNLAREGFKVRTEENGPLAIDACHEFEPDLIILDIMMPEMKGIEVCKRIRTIDQFKDTFIFFLSAKSESYYQEAAFDTGGDDFIEKIIGLRALTGRIKAVLQRKLVIRKRIAEIHVGDLHINRRAGSARIGSKAIPLSKPEFELLFFFAQNPRKIIATDSLLADIWSSETLLIGSSVNAYLDLLTQKLGGEWLLRIAEGKYRLLPN